MKKKEDAFVKKCEHHAVKVSRFGMSDNPIAAKRQLDGFAYYYEGQPGTVTRELVTNFIVGNSLLTAAGFPMCGEFDLKNCIAMMSLGLKRDGTFKFIGADGVGDLSLPARAIDVRSSIHLCRL